MSYAPIEGGADQEESASLNSNPRERRRGEIWIEKSQEEAGEAHLTVA